MYSTAARKVASSADVAPRGGTAPWPFMAVARMESKPFSIRGAQAVLSPSFGALATPVLWQATQAVLYSFSPAGCVAATFWAAGLAGSVAVLFAGASAFAGTGAGAASATCL